MVKRQIDTRRASTFLEERLQNGSTLLSFLPGKLDLTDGQVWTYCPELVDEVDLYRFEESLVPATGTPYAGRVIEIERWGTDELVDLIRTFLETHQSGYYVLADRLAKESDVKDGEPYFLYGDEVYYYATAGSSATHLVWLMTLIIEWQPVALLSTLPAGNGGINRGVQVSSSDLSFLAAHTEVIIAHVYDGEGYLVWSRH
jgi:hypothetical protein